MDDSDSTKGQTGPTRRTKGTDGAREVAERYRAERAARHELIESILAEVRLPGTIERYREFLTLLADGFSVRDAIAIAEIPATEFRTWMRKGGDLNHNKGVDRSDEAEEPYRSFAMAVRAIRAHANGNLVDRVKTGAEKDWRAAAWLLERRDPEHYGRPRTVGVTVDRDGVSVDFVDPGTQTEVHLYIPANGRAVGEVVNAHAPSTGLGPMGREEKEEVNP